MTLLPRGLAAPLTTFGALAALSALAHPARAQFPYNATYPFGGGSVSATQSTHNSAISTRWGEWKTSWITTSGAGAGQRRVLFPDDKPAGTPKANMNTVSEGQAYGMLFAIYFNEQTLFNELWAYFKAKRNSLGLMGWKIKPDGTFETSVGGQDNATDADEDAAAALCFAHKKWGSGGSVNYLSDAQGLIGSLKSYNTWNDGGLKRGNWDNTDRIYNASYFMPAWYRIYKDVTGDAFWDTVISKGYTLLGNAANATTGLIPQQFTYNTSNNTTTNPDGRIYQYDSVRIPWRVGVDYLWFGNQSGKNMAGKIGSYYGGIISTNTANLESPNVLSERQTNGTVSGNYESGAFTGMAGIALQLQPDTAKSRYLLNCSLDSSGRRYDARDYYFSGALHLFSVMTLTGNFPNLYGALGNTAQTITVYGDALAADWQDWSWSSTRNFANTSPVRVGSNSISVNYTAAYGGLSLRKGTAVSTSGYSAIKFWVNSSGSNRTVQVYTQSGDTTGSSGTATVTAIAGTWTEITVSLSSLGSPGTIKRINLQSTTTGTIYFDDIRLVP
jgi:endo-1,4-beta-D-glucanase Y